MSGGREVEVKAGDVYQGKWKVSASIGEGSYGAVYYVEEQKTGKKYAMKVASNSDAATESWALIKLRGSCYFPELIEEFPIGAAFHHTAMILELGIRDLWHLRMANDTGVFEKQTALCLSHHIFAGLEYLHKKSIVHRDCKEANVVLKRDSRNQKHPVMLVDLGLAISNEIPRKPDHRDSFFPKNGYASPWMISGKVATPRCDLTMVLYFLVTWRKRGPNPFNHSKEKSSLQKRIEFETHPVKYVPVEETWILELTKCIFEVEQSATPNYKRIYQILQNAENEFDPKTKMLYISDNKGKDCLF